MAPLSLSFCRNHLVILRFVPVAKSINAFGLFELELLSDSIIAILVSAAAYLSAVLLILNV